MQTSFNLKTTSPTVVIPGVAGKTITVRQLAAAALAPVNLILVDAKIAVSVQARTLLSDYLPFTCPSGADFALSVDSNTPVSGVVIYELQ